MVKHLRESMRDDPQSRKEQLQQTQNGTPTTANMAGNTNDKCGCNLLFLWDKMHSIDGVLLVLIPGISRHNGGK